MSFQPVSKYTRQLMEQQSTYSYNRDEEPTKLTQPKFSYQKQGSFLSLKETLDQPSNHGSVMQSHHSSVMSLRQQKDPELDRLSARREDDVQSVSVSQVSLSTVSNANPPPGLSFQPGF